MSIIQSNLSNITISCGKGWFDLILQYIEYIETSHLNIKILEVYTQYGGIRFNTDNNELSNLLTSQYINKSLNICEKCGASGKLKHNKTRCIDCRNR